jgi:hypothetical protein
MSRLKCCRKHWLMVTAILCCFSAAPVLANTIEYGDFNANGTMYKDVKESSVTDSVPLFGTPEIAGTKLVFWPLVFTSYSASGSADTTSGTLQLKIYAPQGQYLDQIMIKEIGDYTITGNAGVGTTATVNGFVVASDLPENNQMFTDVLDIVMTPVMDVPSNEFGTFEGSAMLDLRGMGISAIMLTFNNNLQTSSESATTSLIQKKRIEITHVPEPATVALIMLGAVPALLKRRQA